MGSALVEGYVAERASLLNTVTVLQNTAKDRGGDPSAADLDIITNAHKRMQQIDHYIDVLGVDMEMDDETRNKLARINPGAVPMAPQYRTAGEVLFDCIHATYGSTHDANDNEARNRWGMTMKRAAEHMGTTAAKTTPVAGGLSGLVVTPIVGPVIDLYPSATPFLTAIGVKQAPNPLNFVRPRIVDPNFTTGAAAQALQKAELVSKKFDVAVDTLELSTVGGYLNVSVQLLALVAASLDIIVNQLSKRVAYQSELAGITKLQTGTQNVVLAAGATAAATIKAIYDAAALVYTATNELPTWIAMGPKGWAMLGSLVDGAGRPLFPYLGAANAPGTMSATSFNMVGPAGLNTVVTPAITTTDLWVGNSGALEAYAYEYPVLEAVEPSVLGRQVAVARSLSFYSPPAAGGATTGNAVRIGV